MAAVLPVYRDGLAAFQLASERGILHTFPSRILETLNEWLKWQPEIWISHSIEHGETIKGDIAGKFFEFYRNNKANEVFDLVL